MSIIKRCFICQTEVEVAGFDREEYVLCKAHLQEYKNSKYVSKMLFISHKNNPHLVRHTSQIDPPQRKKSQKTVQKQQNNCCGNEEIRYVPAHCGTIANEHWICTGCGKILKIGRLSKINTTACPKCNNVDIIVDKPIQCCCGSVASWHLSFSWNK